MFNFDERDDKSINRSDIDYCLSIQIDLLSDVDRSVTDVKGSRIPLSAAQKVHLGPKSITLLVLIDNQ